MRQFLAVLVFAGCLIHGALGAIYCTIADDTPVFSAPDLGIRVVTLVERNTCFNGDMEGEWLVLQDNPIYNIHRYAVIEDIEPAADKNEANGFREYDPWYKQSIRSRCVDVEGINTCAGARSIPNNRQEKRFLLGDATWTNWIEWSACDAAACNAEGTRNRTRQCFVLNPNVQANCYGGDSIQLQKCTQSCLAPCSDGFEWTQWHDCTKTCDGITTRIGYCGNGTANVTISEEKNCTRDLCPVDGTWSEWGTWSFCSTTVKMAPGIRYRNRQCTPTHRHGGAECPGKSFEIGACTASDWEEWGSWTKCLSTNCSKGTTVRIRNCKIQNCNGAEFEEKDCYLEDCPINGAWGAWEGWAVCKCNGLRGRFRHCDSPPPTNGGQDCQDSRYEVGVCNKTSNCSVDGSWGAWEGWSVCYCNGFRPRYRKCDSPPGGQYCKGSDFEVVMCNRTSNADCPVDGRWTDWSAWSTCSVSCENGTQSRNRKCYGTAYGGKDCGSDDSAFQNCSTSIPCPVSGGWSTWSNWTICSATCQATGMQYRNRSCDSPTPENGGQNCTGDVKGIRNCNGTGPCPVNGVWGQWSDWSVCNCNSTQTRVRKCDSPAPVGSGQQCPGSTRYTVSCSDKPTTCPVDGRWGSWYPWVVCSTTCGPGEMVRVRSCNNPRPQNGGLYCDSDEMGEDERKGCQGPPCQIDGSWSDWTTWSACSVTCGNGSHSRNRSCDHPAPAYGGVNCAGSDNENGICTQKHCPIDGMWGSWQSWTSCSVTCLNGTRFRTRPCDSPAPHHGGSYCTGQQNGTETCVPRGNCDVDGGWTEWGLWNVCDVSCGTGHHIRYRLCENPTPENFGKYCEGPEDEVGECFDKPCPIDGGFGAWMAWGSCFPSTGNGLKTRIRLCNNPQPLYGGRNCQGNYTQQLQCCYSDCPDQITCTFDAPLNCSWHNVDLFDNMDWIVFNGSTNTDDTGPSSDHTFGNSTGRYIYLESSAPSKECDKAWYQSGIIQPGFKAPVCVQFWYHMYGADIGSLNIYMATGSELPGKLLWTVSGNQGDVWKSGHVPLSYASNISIIAEATVGNGYHGDIGLDDLLFTQSTCSLYPSMPNTQSAATCPTTTTSPGHWSSWFNGQCSVTCGNGTLTRMRHCSSGHTEDCAGTSSEVIGCQKPPCGAWSAWFSGQCSVTCGNGTLTRMRHCSTGHSEDCVGNSREVIDCQKTPCKVDGVWSSWSLWSQCDVTCEDGHIYRTRMCSNPAPAFGGLNCSGASQEANTCRLARCPDWSPWFNGKCSVTCGNGTEIRVRNCSTGHKEDCAGNSSEVVGCQMAPCEVNGSWSSWSTWSQCDVTCEDGHIQRTRTCTNPAPAFGGLICSGESLETSACKLAKCPSWSEWFLGDCSVTCGDGTLSRMRMCSSGHDEDCPGSAFDTVSCSQAQC